MPKRSKATRNAKYQSWKLAHALSCEDGKAGATGGNAEVTIPQSEATATALETKTAFAPEFCVGTEGLGEALEQARHQWLEIRAVKDRYPVSRGMLERIAHETIQTMLLSTTANRDKLIAAKLLMTMAHGNHPNKGLPDQVEVNINHNPLDMRRIIDAVLNDDSMGILDTRERKVEPGSPDDYAE